MAGKKREKKNYRKKGLFILSLILFLAFLIRIINLGVPPLWIDEAVSSNVAKAILETGLPLFGTGEVYQIDIVFHYLLAFFLFFSQTDFAARLISVVFGLLTVLLAYKFGNEYSKYGGIFSVVLFSFFFLEVLYSRQARFYQMFQFFFFLTIYLLYKSKDKKNYFYLAILSFLITVDTNLLGFILLPVILIYFFKYYKFWKSWLLIIPVVLFVKFRYWWVWSIISPSFKNFNPNFDFDFLSLLIGSIPLFLISVFGFFRAFKKRCLFTSLIFIPCFILIISTILFGRPYLRYCYLAFFPILLFAGIFFSEMYSKNKKFSVIFFIGLIFVSSNLFVSEGYSMILKPIDEGLPRDIEWFNDYKFIPEEIKDSLRNNTLITLYSPDVEWNLKKPDYILSPTPTSTRGIYATRNCSFGLCERFSGSPVLANSSKSYLDLQRPYNIVVSSFSYKSINSISLKKFFDEVISNCSSSYSTPYLSVYSCD